MPLVLQKRAPAFDTVTFTFDPFGAEIPANNVVVFASSFFPTFTESTRRSVPGDDNAGNVADGVSPNGDAVVELVEPEVTGAAVPPDVAGAVVVDDEFCACAASPGINVVATGGATVGTVTRPGTVVVVVAGTVVVTIGGNVTGATVVATI